MHKFLANRLLSALLITLICGPLAAAEELRIGNPGEPQTLDPHRYNLRLEETLLTDLFLGLTSFDARGQITAGAAASWSVSDDGLRWTFQLRSDLRWSDGKPLNAHDFVYSFRRLLDPATAASLAYFMYPLKNAAAVNGGRLPPDALGVSAPEPHTLVLDLEQPYPYLPERLLYPTAFPVPGHVIEKRGDDWVKAENWVSNGAYVLDEWRPQAHVRMKANPHFHESVAIPAVSYLPFASEQAAYNRYRSGEVHAIGAFPAEELDFAARELGDQLRLSPLLSIVYLVYNTTRPPFADARVREALTLVIDSTLLTDRVQRSGNRASLSFVPALVADYEPVPVPHATLDPPQRLDRARRLLADAGFGPDRPLQVTLRHVSNAEAKRTNLAIAAFWKQLGVDARLHQSELKVHFSDLRQGDFDVAQAGWFGENNAEHYLGLLVSDTGNVNYGRYASPGYDSIMSRARALATLPERNAALREAESFAIAEYPVAPLWTVTVRRLVSRDLAGWHENARDVHPVRFLSWQRH
ncbi:MAG: peptide ABC transporter substrate-binding protein [Pseudomonadales bacterium]|nr:peptide ABC transporter substrate-binding protein [Pseudomonadales bacterium]